MTASSAPEFLDLLKSGLEARADLAALTPTPVVYTTWIDADYSITDAIVIGYSGRSGPRNAAELGPNSVDEEPTLDSQIRVMRAGAGQTVADKARDRAHSILDKVDNELRTNHPELTTGSNFVMWARVGLWDYDAFPDPGSPAPLRVYVLQFEILYRARLDP